MNYNKNEYKHLNKTKKKWIFLPSSNEKNKHKEKTTSENSKN